MYENFERLLKERGVTPYRVAKDTGIPCATLTNWKQGKYTPKIEKLQRIADYFGVPLSYLLDGKPPSDESQDMEQTLSGLLQEVRSSAGRKLRFGSSPLTPELRRLLELQLDTLLTTATLLSQSQQSHS